MEKELKQTLDGQFLREEREWKIKVNDFARQYGLFAVGVTQ